MAGSINFLVVLICCFSFAFIYAKPECLDEFKAFGDCMMTSNIPSLTGKPTLMTDVDNCFTNQGCKKPSEFGCDAMLCDRPGPGGRMGPPPDKCKCFSNVGAKLRSEFSFTTCMKNKDPEYGFDNSNAQAAASGGDPAMTCGWMPTRDTTVDVLAEFCDGDHSKASQINSCVKDAFQRNKPDKDMAKVYYDAACKADRICKPRLGDKCDQKIKHLHMYSCECQNEYRSKALDAHNAEQSCANVKVPPGFDKRYDCNKQMENFCDQSFDQYYDSL